MKLKEWNARLHGLVIFRTLLEDPVLAKLLDLDHFSVNVSVKIKDKCLYAYRIIPKIGRASCRERV